MINNEGHKFHQVVHKRTHRGGPLSTVWMIILLDSSPCANGMPYTSSQSYLSRSHSQSSTTPSAWGQNERLRGLARKALGCPGNTQYRREGAIRLYPVDEFRHLCVPKVVKKDIMVTPPILVADRCGIQGPALHRKRAKGRRQS